MCRLLRKAEINEAKLYAVAYTSGRNWIFPVSRYSAKFILEKAGREPRPSPYVLSSAYLQEIYEIYEMILVFFASKKFQIRRFSSIEPTLCHTTRTPVQLVAALVE